ncbi:MAG TPA: FAD-dependent oxidoreductase [Chryseolinea sp.]|nr:FAD-dependent oxidoreductase [Chryseolinea sp.]
MNRKLPKFLAILLLVAGLFNSGMAQNKTGNVKATTEVDVCVYGASAAGIAAAVAVAREGHSVVIVEPTHKIGGLLSAGFRMAQDVPYADHLGGLTGAFYETDIHFPPLRHKQGASRYSIAALQKLIDQYGDLIQVITDHRISAATTVKGTIKEAIFEFAPADENGVPTPQRKTASLVKVKSKVFIDASYEGDLMAFSKVKYRVGKEGKNEYGESLAGVVVSKKFPGVDPYKVKGDPTSGLLSCIHPDPIGREGDSSRFFMAYNFKLAWEANPTPEFPGILITPPQNKNQDVYELLRRYKEAGYETTWPNENFSRGQLMTGTLPGLNTEYPNGDWKTRTRIWQAYVDHIRTLTDFSGKEVRLLSDNNEDTNGWPSYLYIRSARRMVGEYVMTQKDLQLQTDVPTPVGLGYYMVDIYPNRMGVLPDGTLITEGNLWEMVCPGPYQIPYGALIPKKSECTNLIVPLCMSASHIAYSSIRMESTYMVMGEAAGVAAALAVGSNKPVQDIDRKELTAKLAAAKQLLQWDGKGYRVWRYNFLDNTLRDYKPRWIDHPDEYTKKPVDTLWK